MPGSPRKAGGPSKKGAKAAVTVLTTNHDIEIPPMPNAEDWISFPHQVYETKGNGDEALLEQAGLSGLGPNGEVQPEWNPAVVRWWRAIWSSPMAGEFVESDIHGLYLGCYYLHEALNPFYKPGERNGMAKSFENVQKNYGLTPSARETLRWQVAQGTAAQNRTDQLRAAASSGRAKEVGNIQELYGRNA